MPAGEDQTIGSDFFHAACDDARDLSVPHFNMGDGSLEYDLAAPRFDLPAKRGDYAGQLIRTQMRLRKIEDFLRRAGLHHRLQHETAARVADPGS